MGFTDINLADLIGSRICHDLISPIGAINNGLELLSMSDNTAGPELDLIGQSVESASASIRFFRIAFGASGDQLVGKSETASILRDLYQGGRLDVIWQPVEAQPRAAVRLTFLALLCLETAMPYGGGISVTEADGVWTLCGTADKLNVNPDLWGMLAEQSFIGELQPAHVQFALLPAVAGDLSRRIVSKTDATTVTIKF